MIEDRFEDLSEKYEAGNSTLKEEQFLFDHAEELPPHLEAWSTFVKESKGAVPGNLNDKLWDSFRNKIAEKRRLRIRTISAAASVVLLLALLIGLKLQSRPSSDEKQALLTEARNMVADAEQVAEMKRTIYEDEIIVIYTGVED